MNPVQRMKFPRFPIVSRPNWRNALAALIAALTCLVWSTVSAAQEDESKGPWLPFVAFDTSEDGDLVGWRADRGEGRQFDLIEDGQNFVLFQLFSGAHDISDQVVWQRSKYDRTSLAGFVGRHTGLGLEVRRQYLPGIEPGTIVHEMSLSGLSESPVEDVQAVLTIQPKLRRHAPNDDSLGDYFYGYNRILADSPADQSKFELVEKARNASEVALLARHFAIVIRTDRAHDDELIVDPETGARINIHGTDGSVDHRFVLGALELRRDAGNGARYQDLLYSEMSMPMRNIARAIEWTLEAIAATVGNIGAAIVVFALMLRALFLPLGLWSIRQQRQFADVQRRMKPRLKEINKTLSGAEKSEETLKTYKEFGISPFSGLKGSLGLLIQLPILIALFAVTTESAIFRDVSFLWISDLSLPDHAIQLASAIPGVGRYLNVLPFLLGMICVAAALIQSRSTGSGTSSSPRSGLILALIFVIFFYPCAAALVLYWTVVNTSQIFEGLYVSRSKRTRRDSGSTKK